MRGPNYLRDKKKVLADDPLFALAAVDLLEMETPTFHIARYLPSLRCAPATPSFHVYSVFLQLGLASWLQHERCPAILGPP